MEEDSSEKDMTLHNSNLEATYSSLLQEKEKMEEDFNQQRAKLKELFIQKEDELLKKCDDNSSMEIEIEQLTHQIQILERDLEEARSQVTIAACTAENEVEVEKRKCEEEIASVQQIMREELTNADEEIKILKEQVKRFEKEKQQYKNLYEKQVEADMKKDSILSPSMIGGVAKSLAKRVPNLSPAHSITGTPDKLTSTTSQGPSSTTSPLSSSKSPSFETIENLEESMQRAKKDATLLRSLVVPLEEEINALKDKIREQDAQLRMHESQEQMGIKTSEVIAPLFQGKSAEELVQELDNKLQGVKNTLEVEKASRADLELYTAILNTQKTVLTDNVERLREQCNEARTLYDDERREHNELKNTWQRANDQFLEAQRMHLSDMRRIRSLLTAEQLNKFHELQRNDSRDDDSPIIKSQKNKFSPDVTESSKERSSSPLQQTKLSESQDELDKAPSSEDTVSTVLDSCAESEVTSLEGELENPANILAKFSPEKMPQLTDDQKRALSEIENNDKVSVLLEGKENPLTLLNLPSNQRVVSEFEWLKLQNEIKKSRSRMSDSCPLCAGFEAKVKKVEADLKAVEKTNSDLEKAAVRQREDLERESEYRKKTEKEWVAKSEEFTSKVKNLQDVIERVTQSHAKVVEWAKRSTFTMEEKLRTLTDKREDTQRELTRLQKDNDKLIGKHSQHSQEMQNEIINLPDKMEDMQLLLLKYREDVIAAKTAKEYLEDKNNSEILFLKDQVLQEQHEKTSMEDKLSADIEAYRKKLSSLEHFVKNLEGESKRLKELEIKYKEIEQKSHDSNKRSQQLISGLKQQIDEQTKTKTFYEREILELKNRVASLQHDLEQSETVQRDFVRLSQQLQVQLEKIRQSEKEVRWQHEEDVDDCGNCKQKFTTVGRRKHHCKHCGKIFCSECVTKSVPSGPNSRTSRVCDVCHTLLVQEATPFFSTDSPQAPG